MLPNPQVREVNIYDYIKIIRKRLNIIIALLVIVPVTIAIYDFTQKPVFRATVSILVERQLPKVTKFEEINQPSAVDLLQYYQTQYKILASRALADRAFEDLKLSKDRDFVNLKDPVAGIMEGIKVEPVRNSQVVLLSVDDTDALRAAAIANAIAKGYIRQDIEQRNRAAKEAVIFLDSQLEEIKKKMEQSGEELNKYIQQNKIVTVPDIEKKTQTFLEDLRKTKANLERERAEALKRYKAKHPKMIALDAELEEINKKIEQETDSLLELNQKMVQYNVLKREMDSSQQLYTTMLTRAKEAAVSEKLEVSNIRIVDAAKPPGSPYKPKLGKDLLMSALFALFLGVAVSFLLEYLDASIRTAEEVSTYLNLPFLGYIPSVIADAKTESERDLLCFQKPKSTITESYRALRTSILFASPEDKPLKSILITSALPEEGKSFIASNLAIIFAQVNERVILLDVDMRRPSTHKSFNLEQKAGGLSNFLTGAVELEKIIRPTPVPNLSIIPSGTIPPNPSELLTSAKVKLLFDELKTRFDRVIMDSPPILSVADSSLLSNVVDGVVLVVKGGFTRLEAAIKAKEKILAAKGRIIGALVNNIEPEKEDRYYYYHYYYSQDYLKPK